MKCIRSVSDYSIWCKTGPTHISVIVTFCRINSYICADPWHAALLLPSFDRQEFVRILHCCMVYCILAFCEKNEESCGFSQRRTSMEVHTTYKDSYWEEIFWWIAFSRLPLSVFNWLFLVQIEFDKPTILTFNDY